MSAVTIFITSIIPLTIINFAPKESINLTSAPNSLGRFPSFGVETLAHTPTALTYHRSLVIQYVRALIKTLPLRHNAICCYCVT